MMRDMLTQDKIDFYRENGFVILENALDDEELEEWRRCTEEAVAERLGGSVGALTNQMDPDNFYAQVFTQCLRLADSHEGMRKLIMDPLLGRTGATLAGIDGIRVWHDQALIKPPFGNPTAFHLDDPYWSFDSKDSISVWVALDDATIQNGCLWYLPGTHKTATYENVGIGQNLGELFKVYPHWKTIEPVSGACEAGSMVWHNGLTAHAAGANLTTRSRRAMTCAFMPDGSVFNGKRNILPEDYFNALKIGDVLNDDVQNPLVWSAGGASSAT